MVQYMPPFPPGNPFRESQIATTDQGPDFPSSAGDREHGKFRPSGTPRLTTVAVVNDDGTQVGSFLMPGNEEELYLLRGILFALSELASISPADLLDAGNAGD